MSMTDQHHEMNSTNELSALQIIELDILREIDRICRKYDLTYFLVGGSMLGAVRHNGFIPWDDDIDIGMCREDYDRFLWIAEKELPSPYKVHTYKNCDKHHYYFAHVVDGRYQVRRLGSNDKRVEDVWVDIFPIDGFPSKPLTGIPHYIGLNFDRFMYHLAYFDQVNIGRSDRPKWQKAVLRVLNSIHGVVKPDKQYWRNRMDRGLRKYKPDESKLSFNFIGIRLLKELFPSEVFLQTADYKFEDLTVKGPKDYDTYLSGLFGSDYMTPPAENNRLSHPMELLFDEKSVEKND